MSTRNLLFIQLCVLGLLAIPACNEDSFTQVVNIKLPEHQSLPTLSLYLQAGDTTARILVNKSLGILDPGDFNPIANAAIKLLRNGELLTSDFSMDAGSGIYTAQVPVSMDTPGDTYRITVDVPGLGTAFAEQVLPGKPIVSEAVYTPKGTVSPDGERVDEIKVTLQDKGGEKNYYALDLVVGSYYISDDGDTLGIESYPAYLETTDPIINKGTPYSLVFSDDAFDGGSYTVRSFTYESPFEEHTFALLRVHQLTREAFLYARSLAQYENTNGNPFVEPVTVYENVQGGYGAFILSNPVEIRIK